MANGEQARMARALMDTKSPMMKEWKWLARRIMPRAKDVLLRLDSPSEDFKRETCAKAGASLMTLASAFMTNVTPSGQEWFAFRPRSAKDQSGIQWFKKASEITLEQLANSNFYTALQELHLDRCLFGTGALLCERKQSGEGLAFTHIPIGTYGIGEDRDGNVDTLCREFKMTAHQAAERWGINALPSEIRQACERPERKFTDKFDFWHLVCPRNAYTNGNGNGDIPPQKMRYASYYIWQGGNYPVLEEGGFSEFPFLVSRFLKWESAWGYPPARVCHDEIEALLRMERWLDVLAEVAAYPRVFIDAEQMEDVDFRAGGQTVIDRNLAGFNLPREWGSTGRYDIGLDRASSMEKKIESAFYIPFLQVISSVDREMTATEVNARQREQVIAISPTFTQFCSDFNALLDRVFAELWRQGAYSQIKFTKPTDFIEVSPDGEDYSVRSPRVSYQGIIAQSIEMAQKQSLDYALASAGNYIQAAGDIAAVDCVNIPKAIKFIFEASGAPQDVFRTEQEIQTLQEERAAAQQQQMMLLAAQTENQNAKAQQALR